MAASLKTFLGKNSPREKTPERKRVQPTALISVHKFIKSYSHPERKGKEYKPTGHSITHSHHHDISSQMPPLAPYSPWYIESLFLLAPSPSPTTTSLPCLKLDAVAVPQ